MGIIQTELQDSKDYYLTTIKPKDGGDLLVELTHRNVALVEAMIRHDSDYSNSDNADNEDSSAHWLKELKHVLIEGKNGQGSYDEILGKCVQFVDSENSTHLNADGVGREQMTKRLAQLDKQKLVEYLRTPKKEDYKLIQILSEKTKVDENDLKHHPRQNFSFATKFCHYACFYLFEGEDEQDNFSIYDSIVAEHLPKYATHFNIAEPRGYKNDYKLYISLVDAIISASKGGISRNGFDHLLWYYHKAKRYTKKSKR